MYINKKALLRDYKTIPTASEKLDININTLRYFILNGISKESESIVKLEKYLTETKPFVKRKEKPTVKKWLDKEKISENYPSMKDWKVAMGIPLGNNFESGIKNNSKYFNKLSAYLTDIEQHIEFKPKIFEIETIKDKEYIKFEKEFLYGSYQYFGVLESGKKEFVTKYEYERGIKKNVK